MFRYRQEVYIEDAGRIRKGVVEAAHNGYCQVCIRGKFVDFVSHWDNEDIYLTETDAHRAIAAKLEHRIASLRKSLAKAEKEFETHRDWLMVNAK